ncbi:class I SAM-dependent methyltransferase [Stutzerimonas frequens]|uniref:class I SAM-dependent methyltransferase n=1 Tax=Stutzerimonas frequens TaxID=2968969 RepID=UPI00293435E9|nr:class I SAM-dependent methyltransferase [Stutzerimonas frequens]WOC79532.1 class I SAM-dependent methyltransferase [Stutzerimonas frequens]
MSDPWSAAQRTLDHYRSNAQAFREGTREHDVSQNIDALLRHIRAESPLRILDLGCGPGRDLRAFKARGHVAVGLDGTEAFVDMARAESGCEVWQQDLLQLQLPSTSFDGVFANAVLFHVPSSELPRVLAQLHETLRPDGVLFCSNPRGHNEEGWSGDRYGVWYDWPAWRQRVLAAGFTELEHYYRPAGLPRALQPWLASVWRKA